MPTDGAKIKRLRLEAGYGTTRLATEAEVSPGYISRLESGARQASPEVLGRIAKVFRVKVKDLQPATSSTGPPNLAVA